MIVISEKNLKTRVIVRAALSAKAMPNPVFKASKGKNI